MDLIDIVGNGDSIKMYELNYILGQKILVTTKAEILKTSSVNRVVSLNYCYNYYLLCFLSSLYCTGMNGTI